MADNKAVYWTYIFTELNKYAVKRLCKEILESNNYHIEVLLSGMYEPLA